MYTYEAGEIRETPKGFEADIKCITAKTRTGSLMVTRTIDGYQGERLKSKDQAEEVQRLVLNLLTEDPAA